MARFTLRINGRTHEVEGESNDSLLSILRDDLGLTGSKYGCGEGHCGACTVLVEGQAVRSCVSQIGRLAGKSITTIEGIATGDELHPVQQAMLETEAFQCGYCTPGMVMAIVGLLRTNQNPSDEEIARVMDRNVCRCGVFPRVVRAIHLAASRSTSTSRAEDGR
jgi:aerobic-type carbon monoxide dehydrogenase small subunit (CoxS/CutS family)